MAAFSELDPRVDIPLGAPVITADGTPIGVVTEADLYELLVESQRRAHHVYALNLIDIDRFHNGTVQLKLTADETVEQRSVG